jgi:hypothetical protein
MVDISRWRRRRLVSPQPWLSQKWEDSRLTAAGVLIAANFFAEPGIAWTFVTGPTASIDGKTGDLVVSWTEAGLGNTPVTYDLGVFGGKESWQCFTKSGNRPQGNPNAGYSGIAFAEFFTSATITPSNGQITGTLDLAKPVPPRNCTGAGLKECLTAISYNSPMFEDETGEIVGMGSESEPSETVIEIPNDVFSASANGFSPPFFPDSCISE